MDCLLLLYQRCHAAKFCRKLSRIPTKSWNSPKFSPSKVSRYTVYRSQATPRSCSPGNEPLTSKFWFLSPHVAYTTKPLKSFPVFMLCETRQGWWRHAVLPPSLVSLVPRCLPCAGTAHEVRVGTSQTFLQTVENKKHWSLVSIDMPPQVIFILPITQWDYLSHWICQWHMYSLIPRLPALECEHWNYDGWLRHGHGHVRKDTRLSLSSCGFNVCILELVGESGNEAMTCDWNIHNVSFLNPWNEHTVMSQTHLSQCLVIKTPL